MDNKQYLYWSFQSTQSEHPTEKQLKLFQSKYKKDYEKRQLFEGEELLEKFRLNGWRSPIYSELCSIILAFEHKGTLRTKYLEGSEKDLLQTFVNLLKNSFQEYDLVHFDAGIVLPYIGIRLNKNGFINVPHVGLKYQNIRPWDLKGIDIKQFVKGAGDYSFTLEEIADTLSIECEEIIPYEDEFTYYNSGDFASLKTSAINKVTVLSQIHRKLLELPALETILIEERVENVQEVKPTNVFKELNITKQLTLETKEMLKTLFSKKRLSKKDRELTFNLIRASLCDIDPNFGKVKNEKEVDMIINQLKEEFENN